MSDAVHDELAIRDLIARMAHATDRGSLEEYAALLHEDARWIMPGSEPVVGREAIVTAAEKRRATGVSGPGSGCLHMVTSLAVEVDGDTACARSYWMFVNSAKTPPEIRSAGFYDDAFVRAGGRWVFAARASARG